MRGLQENHFTSKDTQNESNRLRGSNKNTETKAAAAAVPVLAKSAKIQTLQKETEKLSM